MNYAPSILKSMPVHIGTQVQRNFRFYWNSGPDGIEWTFERLADDCCTWSSLPIEFVRLLNARGKNIVEFHRASVSWQENDGEIFNAARIANSHRWKIESREPSEARWHPCDERMIKAALCADEAAQLGFIG